MFCSVRDILPLTPSGRCCPPEMAVVSHSGKRGPDPNSFTPAFGQRLYQPDDCCRRCRASYVWADRTEGMRAGMQMPAVPLLGATLGYPA